MTWRIKNGKASPWYASVSSKPCEPTGEIPGTTTLSDSKAIAKQIKPGPRRVPTESNSMQQNKEDKKKIDGKPVDESLILKMQSNLDQFLELQKHQQHLMERFLDMQQQLMDAALNGEVRSSQIALGNRADENTILPEENNIRQPRSPKVPPVPVLPKLTSLMAQRNVEQTQAKNRPQSNVLSTPSQAKDAGMAGSAGQFQKDLLKTVSELTGYPEEMLDLDANLEADLGVDSIKRVEIFSQLEEHHPLLETNEEDTVLEELANLNTLGKIIQWYATNQARLEEEEKKSLKK